jgi:uncharacterized protein (UPF0548 family)
MFSFRKPSDDALRRFLATQARLEFTYTAVGATADGQSTPDGYNLDHTRVLLGSGSTTFESACSALRRWQQFRLGWCEAFPADTRLQSGETVVVVARLLGSWWANAARIVYSIDESRAPIARFGFAYGTLPGHVESGEERFLVEWDRATDQVFYDIRAFSRPRHILSRLGYPFARALQKRFARDSAASMQRAAASPQ